jgi:hypothetical protein
MKVISLALSLTLVLCQLQINEFLSLDWSFVDPDSVKFSFFLSSSRYSETGYLGFGIKSGYGTPTREGADLMSISMNNGTCSDLLECGDNTYPPDRLQSLTCTPVEINGDIYVYTLQRLLDTKDSQDFNLASTDLVRILWSIGEIDQTDGKLMLHGKGPQDRGSLLVFFRPNATEEEAPGFLSLEA